MLHFTNYFAAKIHSRTSDRLPCLSKNILIEFFGGRGNNEMAAFRDTCIANCIPSLLLQHHTHTLSLPPIKFKRQSNISRGEYQNGSIHFYLY